MIKTLEIIGGSSTGGSSTFCACVPYPEINVSLVLEIVVPTLLLSTSLRRHLLLVPGCVPSRIKIRTDVRAKSGGSHSYNPEERRVQCAIETDSVMCRKGGWPY